MLRSSYNGQNAHQLPAAAGEGKEPLAPIQPAINADHRGRPKRAIGAMADHRTGRNRQRRRPFDRMRVADHARFIWVASIDLALLTGWLLWREGRRLCAFMVGT